jgi:hypothetical protein
MLENHIDNSMSSHGEASELFFAEEKREVTEAKRTRS